MAEPDNRTLRLREIREQNEATRGDLSQLHTEVREGFDNINERLKNLRKP